MGRAETVTLLPIDRWAQIMGIHPSWFNQMAGPKAPLGAGCDKVWDQDAREDLARTMADAEQMIADELGYWEAPKFVTDEEIAFGLTGVRSDWYNAEVATEWGLIDCFGTETLTLLQADATVEYKNLDNDPAGREETAEIGTALYDDLPACASACEVAVFFRVADGAEDAADPRWEIRPIKVDIDGTTMHITAESSLFLRPDLMLLTEQDCANTDDPSKWTYNFGTTHLVPQVDVYCRTVNQATPVTLYWDGICECTGICQHSTQLACALNTDKRIGSFIPRPATWNGTTNIEATPTLCTPPYKVFANYRAGHPLDARTCRMNNRLERAIVKLTNALLPEPPCGFCDAAQTRWKHDRTTIDPLTVEAANLPWDLYTQGALEAWRIVKRMAMGRGGKIGR